MNILLEAVISELTLLKMEVQDLKEIIEDPGMPELYKCQATLRLNIYQTGQIRLENAIKAELDNVDIDTVLAQIEKASY